jgi:hypothetical protein
MLCQAASAKQPGRAARLEPNHSHFVLVDTGSTEVDDEEWGAEIELRTMVEESICDDHEDTDDVIAVPQCQVIA